MTAATRPKPADIAFGTDAYDCFLSYSRDPDEALAQSVRKGLAGLAKPWYRRRALRVFLDTASLPASSELENSIVDALERSRYFILLASPAAADRPWVDREVAWWREHRDPHSCLIADCGANLRWDERLGDFVADAPIPASLRGWFPAEPTWTDLSWARAGNDVSLKNPRFSSHIADLAAPMRAMSKDALVDEDIRQHRRSLRLAWSAAGGLLILAVAATLAAIIAVNQRQQAIAQRDRAQSRAFAALAEATRSSDPLASLRNATQSLAIDSTPEAVRALRGTLAVPLRRVFNVNERIDDLQFRPGGRQLAQAARGGVGLWDLRTGKLAPASARGQSFVVDFSFDASGRTLASVGQVGAVNALQVTDLTDGSAPSTVRFGNLMAGAISPDGTTVALANLGGALALRDLRSGRTVMLDRRAEPPFDLQFSPDGRHLLVVDGDSLELWSTTRSAGSVRIPAESLVAARITSVQTVEGVGADGTVTSWSLDGTPLRRTRIEIGPDASIALSADGRLVAVGSGSSLVVWDLVSGRRRTIGSHPGGAITAVAFGPDDRSLASAAVGDALIRIWDLETGPPWPARGGGFYTSILTASPGGALIAATEDVGSAVAVWPRDGGSRQVFRGGDEEILAAGFMRDGRQILTVSDDGAVRVVHATTGRRRLVRSGLGPADVGAEPGPATHRGRGRWRPAARLEPGWRARRHAGTPREWLPRAEFSGTQRRSRERCGSRRRLECSRRATRSADGSEPIDRVEFAPSGNALAGASAEAGAGVFLWRSLDARARPVLLGRHRHFVTAIAFSPDGSGVASAGDTGPVYLWTVDGGSGITLAEGTAQAIGALGFDPTGETLAMSDGTLRVLSCKACGPPRRPIEEANRLQRRGGLP